VEICSDIFFLSLLLAIVKVWEFHSGYISLQVLEKARQSKSGISLAVSLGSILSNFSLDKSKSIKGRSGSSPSMHSCNECPCSSLSIASIPSSESVPRNCLGFTLSSRNLYRYSAILSALGLQS